MPSKKQERMARISAYREGLKAKPSPVDWLSFSHWVFYRSELIPVFEDDYGQSYYYFLNGTERSCGSFNFDPDIEIKRMIDWEKDIYDIIEDESGDFIWIEVFKDRGIGRFLGHMHFSQKGTMGESVVRCGRNDYREKAEKEISRFKDFLNSPERRAKLGKDS